MASSHAAWHDAARRGDCSALRALLRTHGASLAASRDGAGRTALHHLAALPSSAAAAEAAAAVCSAAGSGLEALLEAANGNGHTCLHRAALSGSRDVALALVAAGADPTARTAKERRSPLEVCRDAALRAELETAAAAARARKAPKALAPLVTARQSSGGCAAAPAAEHAAPRAAPSERAATAEAPAAEAPAAAAAAKAVQPPLPPPPLPPPEAEAWETRDGPLSADEAAAAWDRVAAPLAATGGFDRRLAARLIARNTQPPPPLRASLWAAAACATQLRESLLRRGVRLEQPQALSGGTEALCLEVTAGDTDAAAWLALALTCRLSPADAASVALHAARRRPDLCSALGARAKGGTVDYLLYTGVWSSAPANAALQAPLARWLGGGFAAAPDALPRAQLLRAWDAALLGSLAASELMARLAAARIAARADAAVAAAAAAPGDADARGAAVAALEQYNDDCADDGAFDALLAAARAMEWCEPPPPPPDAPMQQRPPPVRADTAALRGDESASLAAMVVAEAQAVADADADAVAVSAALAALRAEAAAAGAAEALPSSAGGSTQQLLQGLKLLKLTATA